MVPAGQTPDVEALLLNTVRRAGGNSRLFIMAATWLKHFADFVAKRRLAMLIRDELENEYQPVMGLLLDWVRTNSGRSHHRYREAIGYCAEAREVGPLLRVNRRNEVLRQLAERRASAISRRWGVWMEEFEVKENALRSAEWIAEQNPGLGIRAICGGDLGATIAADAEAG